MEQFDMSVKTKTIMAFSVMMTAMTALLLACPNGAAAASAEDQLFFREQEQQQGREQREAIPADECVKIEQAAPEKARVEPLKARKLLVFSRAWGYAHTSIPYGKAAIEVMTEKTGAFEATFSDDASFFEKESLARFDAVVFNNTNNEIFLPEKYDSLSAEEKRKVDATDARLKRNLVEYLKSGKGLAVMHAGVASFRKWPEFGEIIGARFDNHPWNSGSKVILKVEDPVHPVAQAFVDAPTLEIADEIYQLKENYSRDKVRVLLSLDMDRTTITPQQKKAIHREDNDFAISYVKSYGQGRVFYCALGHMHELFWNPVVLEHLLDGIQFALGDLKGDTTPSSRVGETRADEGFYWKEEKDSIALMNHDQVVWKLNFDRKLGKAYFHPVALPDGVPLTWLNPPDHPWHRALWFNWKYINGINYWETGPDMGLTDLHVGRCRLKEDFSAEVELTLDYHPKGKPVVLREKRVLNITAPCMDDSSDASYSIEWNSTFKALGKDIVFDRTPPPGKPGGKSWGGYAGMSVRVAAETSGWSILDSEGRKNLECHGKPSRWISCSFVLRATGKEAGIVIFDHPENLNHPSPSFVILTEEIPFVYFSPAHLFHKPYTVNAGEKLTLRYGILVHSQRMEDREDLDKLWKNYWGLKKAGGTSRKYRGER